MLAQAPLPLPSPVRAWAREHAQAALRLTQQTLLVLQRLSGSAQGPARPQAPPHPVAQAVLWGPLPWPQRRWGLLPALARQLQAPVLAHCLLSRRSMLLRPSLAGAPGTEPLASGAGSLALARSTTRPWPAWSRWHPGLQSRRPRARRWQGRAPLSQPASAATLRPEWRAAARPRAHWRNPCRRCQAKKGVARQRCFAAERARLMRQLLSCGPAAPSA